LRRRLFKKLLAFSSESGYNCQNQRLSKGVLFDKSPRFFTTKKRGFCEYMDGLAV